MVATSVSVDTKAASKEAAFSSFEPLNEYYASHVIGFVIGYFVIGYIFRYWGW